MTQNVKSEKYYKFEASSHIILMLAKFFIRLVCEADNAHFQLRQLA